MPVKSKRVQRLLLIDDSLEDRARVRSALLQGAPQRRFLFQEASTAERGLELCRAATTGEFHCVIVDMDMPGMSGLEFLQELSDGNGGTTLPVIVVTGSETRDESGGSLRLGAEEYITKDAVYPSVMFRIIDNAIERHAMSRRLRASEKAAADANRAKSSLIGSISHEIRTPMTAVLGLAELLQESPLNDDQRNLLQMIQSNGAYLIEIVNDLLDLSKMEADMLEISREPVALCDLIDEVVQLMKVRAAHQHTNLILTTASDLPVMVMVDPIRLRQILFNLVGNAIKFTAGGDVSLTVSPSEESDTYLFAVKDNGCGIDDNELALIFEPFAQANNHRGKKAEASTGLGLSICKRLATSMGGSISVQSHVGEGSCFTLSVPLEAVGDASGPGKDVRMLRRSVEDTLNDCRVLVAEDTPATQLLLSRFIDAAGGTVTIVDNGHDLIKTVREQADEIQIVITDVQMPGVSGIEATQEIRSFDANIPIMVLTADAYGATRDAAIQAGANQVLTKPIHRKEFLEALAHLCELADDSGCNDSCE